MEGWASSLCVVSYASLSDLRRALTKVLAMLLQGIEFDEEAAAREEQLGAPKGDAGQWASCIRVVDPASLQTSR